MLKNILLANKFAIQVKGSKQKNMEQKQKNITAQNIKSTIKDFFSKCDQIRRFGFGHIY